MLPATADSPIEHRPCQTCVKVRNPVKFLSLLSDGSLLDTPLLPSASALFLPKSDPSLTTLFRTGGFVLFLQDGNLHKGNLQSCFETVSLPVLLRYTESVLALPLGSPPCDGTVPSARGGGRLSNPPQSGHTQKPREKRRDSGDQSKQVSHQPAIKCQIINVRSPDSCRDYDPPFEQSNLVCSKQTSPVLSIYSIN